MFVVTFLTFITVGGFPSFVEEMKVKWFLHKGFVAWTFSFYPHGETEFFCHYK